MIPKFLNRIEFYFILALIFILGFQFAMFSESREEYKMIKEYQTVNKQLTKENKELSDQVTGLKKDLQTTEEENQDLLGDIYTMNKAAKAKQF